MRLICLGARERSPPNSLPARGRDGAFDYCLPSLRSTERWWAGEEAEAGLGRKRASGTAGASRGAAPPPPLTPRHPDGPIRPRPATPRRVPGKYHLRGRFPNLRTPAAFPPN